MLNNLEKGRIIYVKEKSLKIVTQLFILEREGRQNPQEIMLK